MHVTALTLFTTAALWAAAMPAMADTVLLDYRDDAFLSGSPFYSAAERAEVAAALKRAPNDVAERLGTDFAIRGDATGAFTEQGARERVYLIQKEAAPAIEPFPDAPAPLLVVVKEGTPVGFHTLPADIQYQRLVAAADADGDGRDEVFLETSFMNMGQTVMSVSVASLDADGKASIAQTLREVYVDGCDNPVGARERRAAVISVDGGVTARSVAQTCP